MASRLASKKERRRSWAGDTSEKELVDNVVSVSVNRGVVNE